MFITQAVQDFLAVSKKCRKQNVFGRGLVAKSQSSKTSRNLMLCVTSLKELYLHALHLKSQPLILALVNPLSCMPFVQCMTTQWMLFGWNLHLTLNQHQLKEWLNGVQFHSGVHYCQTQSSVSCICFGNGALTD